MRKNLQTAVSSCINCLKHNLKSEGFHFLQFIKANLLWNHIEIDFIGPLPNFSESYCYVLTVIDVLTGYTIIRALKFKFMVLYLYFDVFYVNMKYLR